MRFARHLLRLGLAALAGTAAFAPPSSAQDDRAAFQELAPLADLVGTWKHEPADNIRARVEWTLGGKAIASSWGFVGADGRFDTYGITVGTFDRAARRFRQLWFSYDLNFITEFEGEYLDGAFHYEGHGHERDRAHLERTVTHDISESGRTWEMDKSFDDGATWQVGHTVTRWTRAASVESKEILGADGADTFAFPELEPLDWLIGDWDIRSSSGPYRCRVRYVMEGKALASTFGSLDASGAFVPLGVTLRTFDRGSGKFRMLWYDERLASITEFEGERDGDGFRYDGHGHRGEQPFLERVEMFDVRPNAYSWHRDVSFDGGKTWRENEWSYSATRVPTPAGVTERR